jgi:hypothetical protein
MRDVPEDEAAEVRELLERHDIDYFETLPGNWGISMPGLWLKNPEEFDRARLLLDEYQQQRSTRMRSDYALRRQRGEVPGQLGFLLAHPVRSLMVVLLLGTVLYLSLAYFLGIQA